MPNTTYDFNVSPAVLSLVVFDFSSFGGTSQDVAAKTFTGPPYPFKVTSTTAAASPTSGQLWPRGNP